MGKGMSENKVYASVENAMGSCGLWEQKRALKVDE